MKKLRGLPVPVIARIEKDQIMFDPRTVLPSQEKTLIEELNSLLFSKNAESQ